MHWIIIVAIAVHLVSSPALTQPVPDEGPDQSLGAGLLSEVETCTATVANRSLEIVPGLPFSIPNVPNPQSVFRVRLVCETAEGTVFGQTPFLLGVPNGITDFPTVEFLDAPPLIPVTLELTSPSSSLSLGTSGVQLTLTGVLVDGSRLDLTLGENGTLYLSSNPAIATVSADGFVNAVSSGTVLISATNEGIIATIELEVELEMDRDGDGIPDDFEDRNAVNPGGANLARLPGVVVSASSFLASRPPARGIDGNQSTSWFTANGDAVNLGASPFFEVTLPQDINLAQIRMFGNRESPDGFDFFAGLFSAFAEDGTELFNSGEVMLPAPNRDVSVPVDVNGIRRVRFSATNDEGPQPGFSEIQLISRPGGVGLDSDDPADANLDFDLDSLTNLEEFDLGTSIFLFDTDGDGVSDSDEQGLGSNPLLADSDNDGLLDGDEAIRGSDPLNSDSDGDGLSDGAEVAIVGNPFGANPLADNDGDGLNNLDEIDLSTDPTNPDTDGDGMTDGQEVLAGEDPLVPEMIPPTVVIVNPLDGGTLIEGQTLSVEVDATDNGILVDVEISVNGVAFIVDMTAPYELTFTVPAGVDNLVFSALARDVAGNQGVANDATLQVIPDALTTVEGSVVDVDDNPVDGAEVVVNLPGLNAEFFDFATPLNTLPDLTGLAPDVSNVTSAVNIVNPNQLFGEDPFGVGLAPDFAARFTGSVRINTPGLYTFILGADEGAELIVDGTAVVHLSTGIGEFQEDSGAINLSAGLIPLEILYYESNGAAELQLSYIPPGGERQVVSPGALIPDLQPFGLTNEFGEFSISDVPTNLGNIRVDATFTTADDRLLSGASPATPPVPAEITDVGEIVVTEATFEEDLGVGLNQGDDDFDLVALPFSFPFFGVNSTEVFVGSNGYLTFGSGDTEWIESVNVFLSPQPRIAPFFDDLDPRVVEFVDGIDVRDVFVNDQIPGKFVVTWNRVAEFSFFGSNTLQTTLFADGRILFAYRDMNAQDAIVGLSPGGFPAPPSVEIDYSGDTPFNVPGGTAVFEQFFGSGNNPFDLVDGFILFTPNAGNGYDVTTVGPSP